MRAKAHPSPTSIEPLGWNVQPDLHENAGVTPVTEATSYVTNTSRCGIYGWVLLALIGGSGARAQESGAKGTVGDVLTVCEVLESADKYDGKTICVRGEVITDRHGYSLRCSNASPTLCELWRPFPMEISLQRAVG